MANELFEKVPVQGTQHDKGIILRNIGIRILVGTQQVKNRMPE